MGRCLKPLVELLQLFPFKFEGPIYIILKQTEEFNVLWFGKRRYPKKLTQRTEEYTNHPC